MTRGRCLAVTLALALATATLCAPLAGAQQRDSLRAGAGGVPADSMARDTLPRRNAIGVQLPKPPLSPRRAFLTSLAVPGYAQARLERPLASALFFTVETAGALMLRKSLRDLSIAERYEGDSIIVRYELDPITREVVLDANGQPVVAERAPGRFTADLVKARRTHVEDWIAVLVFNHLFAGADAFVSAQLWDVPAGVSLGVLPTSRGGTAITASFRW